jgi:hypothetical protein
MASPMTRAVLPGPKRQSFIKGALRCARKLVIWCALQPCNERGICDKLFWPQSSFS